MPPSKKSSGVSIDDIFHVLNRKNYTKGKSSLSFSTLTYNLTDLQPSIKASSPSWTSQNGLHVGLIPISVWILFCVQEWKIPKGTCLIFHSVNPGNRSDGSETEHHNAYRYMVDMHPQFPELLAALGEEDDDGDSLKQFIAMVCAFLTSFLRIYSP